VDNTIFVDSFRDITHRFVHLLDSLSALKALSSLESAHDAEERLLSDSLRVLVDNQHLGRCSVLLLHDDELHYVAGHDGQVMISGGNLVNAADPTVLTLGEGLAGTAAASGEVQKCTNCDTDPRIAGSERTSAGGALICIPIAAGGETLGVLSASHPRAGFFDEAHERILVLFCSFLGQMLLNSRLVGGMQQRIQERTQQLEGALHEAEQLKQRYEQLSIIDALTELHNRRFFFPEAQAALARAARRDHPFSVMVVDLDNFKSINDTYGHAAGDRVLQTMAALLKQQIREGDILARFGGEEFVLALPNTDSQGVRVMALRILQAVRDIAWEDNAVALTVTATIGTTSWCNDGEHVKDSEALLDQLIQEADQALYSGKKRGRDQARAFAELADGE
jgi:diguanylate cyclase (GGDEF)-like protein